MAFDTVEPPEWISSRLELCDPSGSHRHRCTVDSPGRATIVHVNSETIPLLRCDDLKADARRRPIFSFRFYFLVRQATLNIQTKPFLLASFAVTLLRCSNGAAASVDREATTSPALVAYGRTEMSSAARSAVVLSMFLKFHLSMTLRIHWLEISLSSLRLTF